MRKEFRRRWVLRNILAASSLSGSSPPPASRTPPGSPRLFGRRTPDGLRTLGAERAEICMRKEFRRRRGFKSILAARFLSAVSSAFSFVYWKILAGSRLWTNFRRWALLKRKSRVSYEEWSLSQESEDHLVNSLSLGSFSASTSSPAFPYFSQLAPPFRTADVGRVTGVGRS
jgi:hypothetical protein